jgi:beta-galactosidase
LNYTPADTLITFEVSGPARILGVGNGNPVSHEPDKFTNQRRASPGLCAVIIELAGVPGPFA